MKVFNMEFSKQQMIVNRSNKFCQKCQAIININDDNVICKTKVVTKTGRSSSGCSITRFWFCSIDCAPKNNTNLPMVNGRMIVNDVVNERINYDVFPALDHSYE